MVRAKSFLLYIAVSFGFSWLLWLLMILSQHGMLGFKFPLNPLGSFGPALGAIAVAAATGGRAGVRTLLFRLFQYRFPARWYLFAFFSFAGICAAALALFYGISGSLPHLQNLNLWYMVLPFALIVLVLGGPLGEEIGWRGFLLPGLQSRFNSLTAGVLVGFVWALWHLPLMFLKGTPQHDMNFAAFSLFVIACSILYTWLHDNTSGSLLAAILFHTSMNTLSVCLGTALPDFEASKLGNYLLLGTAAIVAVAVAVRMRRSREAGRDAARPTEKVSAISAS